MSQLTNQYTVCNGCGGAIPSDTDHIKSVSGVAVIDGSEQAFAELDFCCSAHLAAWVAGGPQVATPSPLYAPPPEAP